MVYSIQYMVYGGFPKIRGPSMDPNITDDPDE